MAFALYKRKVRDTKTATLRKAKFFAIAFTLICALAAFGLGVAFTKMNVDACDGAYHYPYPYKQPVERRRRPIVFAINLPLLTIICVDVHIFCHYFFGDRIDKSSTALISLGAYGTLSLSWLIQMAVWAYFLAGTYPTEMSCFEAWEFEEARTAHNLLVALACFSIPILLGCLVVAGFAAAENYKGVQARNVQEFQTEVLDQNGQRRAQVAQPGAQASVYPFE